jgi:hypothetical protein
MRRSGVPAEESTLVPIAFSERLPTHFRASGRMVANTEITTQYTGEWGNHPATESAPTISTSKRASVY